MKDIEICQYELSDANGKPKGRVAILRGGLSVQNPLTYMNEAVSIYVGNAPYNEFIEIEMDNPWVRVVVGGINELNYQPFKDQRLYEKI